MKRTVLIVLGSLTFVATSALAGGPPVTPGVAAAGSYQCYKAKDLKTPQFAGSTVTVADEFAAANVTTLKKPFLYCTKIGSSPNQILSCYKVKAGKLTGANRAISDGFGTTVDVATGSKVFVFCSPGTGS